MKPLIKWPGGKFGEFKYIEQLIPQHDRYIEPFFGGGAIFFHMSPPRALINDLSADLMQFYTFVKQGNKTFKQILYTYNDLWTKIMGMFIDTIYPEIYAIYIAGRLNATKPEELCIKAAEVLDRSQSLFLRSFDGPYIGESKQLYQEVRTNLLDKLKRMIRLENSMGKLLDERDLRNNIETGFRSGFYMHLRNLHNRTTAEQFGSTEEKTAVFYFIREFCYGSMFRYNRRGHFNIPYGGIAYNTKNFQRKLDDLFLPKTREVFKNTKLYNMDFEAFLQSLDLQASDFVFLDPPYDSEFSDYEGVSFDQEDQRRLADFLLHTKARFILIIKATEYVTKLYGQKKSIRILDFDKQYTYNVRSRNNRTVKHLIITNCQE